MGGWAEVGLWAAVYFLAKISLHRPTCKTTFARLTQSQAISQSFRVFISFRSMRDTTFFSFFETLFYTKLPFPLPWWSKDLLVDKLSGICMWRAVNFEIHLWSSGMNADCICRSISIQHVQIEAGLNSDPGNNSFWDKIRDAKHVDRSTHYKFIVHVDRRRWRSVLVWSHQLTSDLKRCLLFRKCLRGSSLKAVSVPTSVKGGLRGSTATSDIVRRPLPRCYK